MTDSESKVEPDVRSDEDQQTKTSEADQRREVETFEAVTENMIRRAERIPATDAKVDPPITTTFEGRPVNVVPLDLAPHGSWEVWNSAGERIWEFVTEFGADPLPTLKKEEQRILTARNASKMGQPKTVPAEDLSVSPFVSSLEGEPVELAKEMLEVTEEDEAELDLEYLRELPKDELVAMIKDWEAIHAQSLVERRTQDELSEQLVSDLKTASEEAEMFEARLGELEPRVVDLGIALGILETISAERKAAIEQKNITFDKLDRLMDELIAASPDMAYAAISRFVRKYKQQIRS